MIYEDEYKNCIHFDGKECRHMGSHNYGSYGEECIDCPDIEVVIKEIKKSDLIQAINECRPLKDIEEENQK